MSTAPSSLDTALSRVPRQFRDRIVARYRSLKEAYVDHQFDVCGLRAGKLCEVLVRYLQEELTGSFTPFGTRITNFTDECLKLERLPASAGHESYRLILPRALNYAYTLRNKRDFGHEGGDVEANEIDAATVVRVMDWSISEVVRLTHAVPLEDAQALLDAIAERQIPLVWDVPGGKRRVLDASLSQADQALVLLYSHPEKAVPVEDLADWVGAARLDDFKRRALATLRQRRFVEFDQETGTVILSPSGSGAAEVIVRRLRSLP
jgi:hypothetical protein